MLHYGAYENEFLWDGAASYEDSDEPVELPSSPPSIERFSEAYILRKEEAKWRSGWEPWSRNSVHLCWECLPFALTFFALTFAAVIFCLSVIAIYHSFATLSVQSCSLESFECVTTLPPHHERCCTFALSLPSLDAALPNLFEKTTQCYRDDPHSRKTRLTSLPTSSSVGSSQDLDDPNISKGPKAHSYRCVVLDDIFLLGHKKLASATAAADRQANLGFLGTEGLIFTLLCFGVYVLLTVTPCNSD